MQYLRTLLCVLILPIVGLCQEDPQTVQAIARQTRESIVVVTTEGRGADEAGMGTGFVIDAEGLIATNLHVIGEARPVWVQMRDGKRYEVTEVFASDRNMDLAILRIKPESRLAALELAAGDLVEGQQTIAIGHPLGLKNSVVSGLVAGVQNFEGYEYWQVAMTIEPGNSGGPLLDMNGKVRGVMARKSLALPFGFAVKTASLRALIEKPNPTSIEQWKTIGRLDPSRWQATSGARWRQKQGKILVEGTGEGFGGRSLLLRSDEQPAVPFELAVSVKLDDESGAAGLVFHSDKGDRHYGFYPSGGSVRLSSFNGPTQFTWNVIEEIDTEHYRRGEWNELKVRVEKDRIVGYVNGHEVVSVDELTQPPGAIGLCKFRHTSASFRHFEFGNKVASRSLSKPRQVELERQLDTLGGRETLLDIDLIAQTTDVGHRLEILKGQASDLENQAKELRELGKDIHLSMVCNELRSIVKTEKDADIDLLRGALWISRLDNVDLDVEAYVDTVESMVATIKSRFNADMTDEDKLVELDRYLFAENGFHGSRAFYYRVANSHMDRVIDDREGIPVTLSVLYMSLAKRLGLNVVGVGLPGHFVVRHEPVGKPAQIVDVYDRGKRMTRAEARAMVFERSGRRAREQDFATAGHAGILSRMLNNMLGLSNRDQDPEATLRYIEATIAVTPTPKTDSEKALVGDLRGMRAVFRHRLGRKAAAIDDLDWLLERKPPDMDLNQVRRMRALFSQ